MSADLYTLSLHDALPIWIWDSECAQRLQRAVAASDHHPARRAEGAGAARPGHRGEGRARETARRQDDRRQADAEQPRSEEHTSELQSLRHLVCRLLLEKK